MAIILILLVLIILLVHQKIIITTKNNSEEAVINREELQAAKALTLVRIAGESSQYWRPHLWNSNGCGHLDIESHNKTTAHLVFFMLSLYMMSKILDNFFWLLFGNNIFI